ncbi:unnamed protein product, partial [Sphacelaria rigidula]
GHFEQPPPQTHQLMHCPYCGNMNPRLFLDAGQGYARCHGVHASGVL